MEKRKLLLVAISAGIFLVIAIGAAIVFTPQGDVAVSQVAPVHPVPGGITVNVAPPHTLPPPIQPAPVDPVGLVRGPVDGLQPPPPGAGWQGGFPGDGAETVITVPRPTAAAIPDPPPAPAPVVTPAPPPPRPAPPAPRPAPVAVPAPPPPAAAPAPVALQTDFWVQAGSFSTLINAERARESLALRGITSIIENREVGGRDWFRVRIGPYASQDEADHWLALVRSIDGFDSEQERYRPAVWQTARR